MTTFVSSQSAGESFSDSSICVTSRARGRRIDVTLPAAPTCPTGNFLLAALPKWQQRKLQADLELVLLPSGKVLAEPGEPQAHAYFPTTSLISLSTPIEGRGAEEVAVAGSDGMIGVSLLLEGAGARGRRRRAVFEGPGYAYRLRAETLVGEFNRGGEMRQLLLHYTQALITQIAQTKESMLDCCGIGATRDYPRVPREHGERQTLQAQVTVSSGLDDWRLHVERPRRNERVCAIAPRGRSAPQRRLRPKSVVDRRERAEPAVHAGELAGER